MYGIENHRPAIDIDLNFQRRTLKLLRLIRLLASPSFAVSQRVHIREVLSDKRRMRLDRKPTQARLLHAAVVANLFAVRVRVAHVLQIRVSEPLQRFQALHFLNAQNVCIEPLDLIRNGLHARCLGGHLDVVVFPLQGGVINGVEEVLHVVGGNADCPGLLLRRLLHAVPHASGSNLLWLLGSLPTGASAVGAPSLLSIRGFGRFSGRILLGWRAWGSRRYRRPVLPGKRRGRQCTCERNNAKRSHRLLHSGESSRATP